MRRGIACGALVDPWNILGFQGQYPRFTALEDSVFLLTPVTGVLEESHG